MNVYRIHTEATGAMRERAIAETAKVFDGFTVVDAVGFWKGEREHSMVIEILAGPERAADVQAVGAAIATANNQEAVLIEEFNCAEYFCTNRKAA